MKKINLTVSLAVLAVAGCTTVSRIPDEKNPALSYGEATYFAQRCPKLTQKRFLDAALAYCLSNKIYAGGCEKKMVDNFFADQERGKTQAKQEFDGVGDGQVCRIAQARYGEKGSRFAGVLTPRR